MEVLGPFTASNWGISLPTSGPLPNCRLGTGQPIWGPLAIRCNPTRLVHHDCQIICHNDGFKKLPRSGHLLHSSSLWTKPSNCWPAQNACPKKNMFLALSILIARAADGSNNTNTTRVRRIIFWAQSSSYNERTTRDILQRLQKWKPQVLFWSQPQDSKSERINHVMDALKAEKYWKPDWNGNAQMNTKGRLVNAELQQLFEQVFRNPVNDCETIMVLGPNNEKFVRNTNDLCRKNIDYHGNKPFVAVLESCGEDSWEEQIQTRGVVGSNVQALPGMRVVVL